LAFFKFVKQYFNGAQLVRENLEKYTTEVKNRQFPSDEFTY